MSANQNKDHKDVNWYEDKYQSLLVWRSWLFVITIICLIGIMMMTIALYIMVPLKNVKPFVIQVDENTGKTKVIVDEDAKKITQNDLLVQYFIRNYVDARETYSLAENHYNHKNIVSSMSSGRVYQDFQRFIKSDGSPYKRLSNGKRIVSIYDIEKIGNESKKNQVSWRVFFEVQERVGGRRDVSKYRSKAIVSVGIGKNENVDERRALYNPMGILVLDYRLDDNIDGKRS